MTPRDALELCLNRIDRFEAKFGAFEVIYEDEVRQAEEAAKKKAAEAKSERD